MGDVGKEAASGILQRGKAGGHVVEGHGQLGHLAVPDHGNPHVKLPRREGFCRPADRPDGAHDPFADKVAGDDRRDHDPHGSHQDHPDQRSDDALRVCGGRTGEDQTVGRSASIQMRDGVTVVIFLENTVKIGVLLQKFLFYDPFYRPGREILLHVFSRIGIKLRLGNHFAVCVDDDEPLVIGVLGHGGDIRTDHVLV